MKTIEAKSGTEVSKLRALRDSKPKSSTLRVVRDGERKRRPASVGVQGGVVTTSYFLIEISRAELEERDGPAAFAPDVDTDLTFEQLVEDQKRFLATSSESGDDYVHVESPE